LPVAGSVPVRGLAHWFWKLLDGSNTPAVQEPPVLPEPLPPLPELPELPSPPPQPAAATVAASTIQRSPVRMERR
jgi:hypothetical protein